jgi:predicted ATP-grasp superfamily ATP-dependent carboligase
VIDHSVPVVVIYRGGIAAVSIARTLGRLGVPVYLVAQQGSETPVWSSRHWAEKVRWDFARPEEDSLAFLRDFGAKLQAKHGARAILLTLSDWVAVFIERNSRLLSEQFLFPQAARPVIHTLLNKWGMHQLAIEHGIPTPATFCPTSVAELDNFLATTDFPVMVKPADPFVEDRRSPRLIQSKTDLMDYLGGRAAAEARLNVVLQEYIPGDVESVWMCNGYFGADDDRAVVFPGKKLRQVSAAGIASLAVCVPNETVATQTREFMQGVGYRGCVGIGWRYDSRDGLYKLLDVNARVSGVFRLFAGTNDMDVVRLCYLDLTGQAMPSTALQPGRKWMLESDFASAIRSIREDRLTVRGWLKSVRGVQEWHWLAWDDPRPFLVWMSSGIRSIGLDAVRRVTDRG